MAADVGTPMARLARLFTKASYSPGDPSEEEVSQAWAEVETLTRALDSSDLLPGPLAAAPEPRHRSCARREDLELVVVFAEGLAEVLAGVSEEVLQPGALHRRGQALETGLAHLADVALDEEGAAEHGQEADEEAW